VDLSELVRDIELVQLVRVGLTTFPPLVGGAMGVINAIDHIRHDSRSEPRHKDATIMGSLGKYFIPLWWGIRATDIEGSELSNIVEATTNTVAVRVGYETVTRVTKEIVHYIYRHYSQK